MTFTSLSRKPTLSYEHHGSTGLPGTLTIMFSAILLAAGLALKFLFLDNRAAIIPFLAASAVVGRRIVVEGISAALKGKLNISFLMTIAAVGAFLSDHAEEGAAVLFLFFIAESLEEGAAVRNKRSIEALIKLAPETAIVRRNGREVEVHVHDVSIGEICLVRPGARIPLDGVIVNGSSSLNQSSITGESMPVSRGVGDQVFAGSINNEGFIEVRATKKSSETVLSKIVGIVEAAQRKRSETEKFVDKFSTYYTPSVITLALLIATVPTLLFGLPWGEWGYRALVLLVVSCPCALAISTPVTILSSITSATRWGVLVKGGTYIEEASKTRAVAFDKTGTLTYGRPKVTDVVPLENSGRSLLSIAASLEWKSEHPTAKAVVEHAKSTGLFLMDVEDFEAISGKGVKGSINGELYWVGSKWIFEEMGLTLPGDRVEAMERAGRTVMLVGTKQKILGLIGVMDDVREEAEETVKHLKVHGIKTVMLTGDNETVAEAITGKLGIDEYYANLLPEEKLKMVEELRKKYGSTAMIGDGVNDAPALAKASIGIAMGAIGSDVALETADIALMKDELEKLPYLIDLSVKTMRRMKENIFGSIAVKGVFAVLAILGLTTLWMAVAIGDMGVSLAVILNAMRIANIQPSMLRHSDHMS